MEVELRAQILVYLESLAAADSQDESLDVAVQCLRESFRAPPQPAAAVRAGGPGLLEAYSAGVAALSADAAPAPTASEPSLERFVASLEQRGYFAGTTVGSAEHAARLTSAKQRFAARFAAPKRVVGDGDDAPAGGSAAATTTCTPTTTPSPSERPAAAAATPAEAVAGALARGAHDDAIAQASRVIDAADAGDDADGAELAELLGLRALALVHRGGDVDGAARTAAVADAETAVALADAPAAPMARARLGLTLESAGLMGRACEAYADALAGALDADARRASLLAHARATFAPARPPIEWPPRMASGQFAGGGRANDAPGASGASGGSSAHAATDGAASPFAIPSTSADGERSVPTTVLAAPAAPVVDFSQLASFLTDPSVSAARPPAIRLRLCVGPWTRRIWAHMAHTGPNISQIYSFHVRVHI